MGEIFVHKIELPAKIKGTTVLKDGDYIIFINSLLCEETQQKALEHELAHITNNDLYNDCINVNICEYLAGLL